MLLVNVVNPLLFSFNDSKALKVLFPNVLIWDPDASNLTKVLIFIPKKVVNPVYLSSNSVNDPNVLLIENKEFNLAFLFKYSLWSFVKMLLLNVVRSLLLICNSVKDLNTNPENVLIWLSFNDNN